MASTPKKSILLMACSFAIVLFSCNSSETTNDETAKTTDPVKNEKTTAPAFTPFKVLIVKHAVANFNKWKEAYLAHDSMRMVYGISNFRIGRGTDSTNVVIVIDKISDIQKAKDFSALPDLKDAMQKGGVTGKPEFAYADVVWNDDSQIDQKDRLMVSHKVKDFDTWKKAFDAEGKTKRLEYCMIDRGIARGIDDPEMVYVVFALTDKNKAKARANSEELKKLMADAGVTVPAQMFYYKVVE